MNRRNFYITIGAIVIGISIFWLSAYAFVLLDIDPFQNLRNLTGGEDTVVLTIEGNVNQPIDLTLSDLKSDKYDQVVDQTFHLINAIGNAVDLIFSGVSLWSILEEEELLTVSSSTFLFIGGDGYYSETPLALSLAEENSELVILAYEQDGQPLFLAGPVRSIINASVIPTKATTHYAIKNLVKVLIE